MTKRNALSMAILLGLAAAMPVAAQQSTSAGLGGRILDASGAPVANATIEIVHEPTGTRKTVTTDADGRYSARGLRVGGPFTVTATKDGMDSESRENVYLLLAEQSAVNLTLGDEATELAALEVTASAATVFAPDNMGSNTNVSQDQIESLPTIGRSLNDFVRADPRIQQTDKERGEISAGGQNSRYNSINVDGVSTNDPFGLESNGLPTSNQPLAVDWIQEISISTSSYDVTDSDFVGANINAVTKSGSNDWSGSMYYLYRNAEDWTGDNAAGTSFRAFDDQFTTGFTFGGPIIKDALFFFVGYETYERSGVSGDVGILGSGASTIVPISQAQLDQAIAIARDTWGFDAGSASQVAATGENTDDKYIVKFDWNINDAHRASMRYNLNDNALLRLPNNDNDDVALSSHWYTENYDFENYVVSVFSDWTDSFSSEFQASFSSFEKEPSDFTNLPEIAIDIDSAGNQINLGRERFRHTNILGTDTTTAYWAGEWFLGDHTLKFGADYRMDDIYNLFVEASGGSLRFRPGTVNGVSRTGLENFASGNFSNYDLRLPTTGFDPAARFDLESYGLFLQDSWAVNYNLSINYGLRVDIPNIDDRPLNNPLVLSTYGVPNDLTIDGNTVVQPRFGFNYTFDSERPTQLRGGFGLFQGSAANVWLANNFTNNGRTITVYTQTCGTTNLTACDVTELDYNDPQIPTGTNARQDVDILAPDFEQPTVWKANLAFDHELPWYNLVFSAEAQWAITDNAIFYEHLNLGDAVATLPDGRLSYWRNTNRTGSGSCFSNNGGSAACRRARANSAFNDVLLARNSTKGDAFVGTVSLEKSFEDNWFAKVAYTYTDAEEVNPLTSSRAISNWNGRAIFNPNEDIASRANTAVQDRFIGILSYRHNFFADYATKFTMFAESRDGRPYSWIFNGDMNGDGITNNDLFYVPNGPGEVIFSSATEEASFWAFIEGDEYLNSHRGQVVGRNEAEFLDVNQIDFRIAQELPGFFGDNKAEVYLDIQNVGNLINEDWGRIQEIGFPFTRNAARFTGIDPATGRMHYSFTTPGNPRTMDNGGESRWAIQVGVKYEF